MKLCLHVCCIFRSIFRRSVTSRSFSTGNVTKAVSPFARLFSASAEHGGRMSLWEICCGSTKTKSSQWVWFNYPSINREAFSESEKISGYQHAAAKHVQVTFLLFLSSLSRLTFCSCVVQSLTVCVMWRQQISTGRNYSLICWIVQFKISPFISYMYVRMSELYEDHFSLVFKLVYLMEHVKKMQLIKQQTATYKFKYSASYGLKITVGRGS